MLTSDKEDNVPLMHRAIEGMSCKRAERTCDKYRDLVIETQNKMHCFIPANSHALGVSLTPAG